jgi:hypothetical protein
MTHTRKMRRMKRKVESTISNGNMKRRASGAG